MAEQGLAPLDLDELASWQLLLGAEANAETLVGD